MKRRVLFLLPFPFWICWIPAHAILWLVLSSIPSIGCWISSLFSLHSRWAVCRSSSQRKGDLMLAYGSLSFRAWWWELRSRSSSLTGKAGYQVVFGGRAWHSSIFPRGCKWFDWLGIFNLCGPFSWPNLRSCWCLSGTSIGFLVGNTLLLTVYSIFWRRFILLVLSDDFTGNFLVL